MIDELKAVDTGKHEVIIKWQLFLNDGINVPLGHDVFDYAYKYGNEQGYKVTSSVADLESLKFLLQYDVPFIKLPNCRELDWLIGEVPRRIPLYISYGTIEEYSSNSREEIKTLACISKYPANIDEYIKEYAWRNANGKYLYNGGKIRRVSDHTVGLYLYKKFQPQIWEKHFKLLDSTGLDAGPFAITPDELREVL
jgi:sialic acid synthase SpsE